MVLKLTVNVSFTIMFFVHLRKVLSVVRNLKISLSKKWEWSDFGQATDLMCLKLRKFAFRRTVIILVDTLWLILIYGIINNLRINQKTFSFLCIERILEILHQLSMNTLSYFMLYNPLGSCFLKRKDNAEIKKSLLQEPIAPENVNLLSPMRDSAFKSRFTTGFSSMMTLSTGRSEAFKDFRVLFTMQRVSTASVVIFTSENESSFVEEEDFLGLTENNIADIINRFRPS